jgi:hypothetical protein
MVTHLGPGAERHSQYRSDRHAERSKAKAGASLMLHINQYTAKGFRIKRVTSDGEPAIKAAKHDLEAIEVELNVLGHGSHTPHAESAIRHIKNKGRSTLHSLLFPLPSKLVAALITFVVHTSNMVPKANAIGHFPAHTAFLGRVPNLAKDAPFAFGTAGFLQRASGPLPHEVTTAFGSVPLIIWLVPIAASTSTLSEKSQEIFSDQLSLPMLPLHAFPSSLTLPLENVLPTMTLNFSYPLKTHSLIHNLVISWIQIAGYKSKKFLT